MVFMDSRTCGVNSVHSWEGKGKHTRRTRWPISSIILYPSKWMTPSSVLALCIFYGLLRCSIIYVYVWLLSSSATLIYHSKLQALSTVICTSLAVVDSQCSWMSLGWKDKCLLKTLSENIQVKKNFSYYMLYVILKQFTCYYSVLHIP